MDTMAVPGGWDFGSALNAWMPILGGKGALARPVRLTSEYARAVADGVLEASSRADLEDRIDVAIADDRFWESMRPTGGSPSRGIHEISASAQTTNLDIDSLSRALGPAAAERCRVGWEAIKKILQMAADRISATPEAPRRSLSRYTSPTDVLYDSEVPLELRKRFTQTFVSGVAAIAIARAEERDGRLSPWLAMCLAEAFAHFAEDILSEEGRRTIKERVLQDIADRVHVEAADKYWSQAAKASGLSVYVPEVADAEGH